MLAHPQGEAPDFAVRELLDNAVDLCTVAPALPPEPAGYSAPCLLVQSPPPRPISLSAPLPRRRGVETGPSSLP
jgi:hypothetical protein